jgi:hypothetical protein
VNSKYVIPLYLAAGLFMLSIIIIKGQWIFLLMKLKVNDATTIITSLNKEESKKVYDYLVKCWAQKATDATLDLENFIKSIPKDDAKYAAIVAGLPIDNALKYESGLACSNIKFYVDFSHCFSWSYVLVF